MLLIFVLLTIFIVVVGKSNGLFSFFDNAEPRVSDVGGYHDLTVLDIPPPIT